MTSKSPAVANPESILDHAGQVAGKREMAEGGGGDQTSERNPVVFVSYVSLGAAIANAIVGRRRIRTEAKRQR